MTRIAAPAGAKTGRGKLGGSSLKHPKPKATVQEAEAETVDGLKKRKSSTDTEPPPKPPKMKKTKKGEVEETEDAFKGCQGQHHLKEAKAPNSHKQAEMCQSKLAVASTPAQYLILGADWSTETYTKYLAKLFPDTFRYIESHPYAGDTAASCAVQAQKWPAVIKTNQSVHLSGEEHPDGTEVSLCCKRRGIRSSDLIFFIATKIAIPPMRYSNWDLELESEAPEAGEVFDYDMLDTDDQETPRKPSAKAKGKGKARRSISPVVKLKKGEAAASLEKAETSEEDTSDMKKAAKMRTRLDTQSIKRKVFRMPDNSKDERPVFFEMDDSDDKVTFPKPATLFSKVVDQSPLFSSFLSPDGDVISPFPSQPPSPTGTNSSSASSSVWASTSSLPSTSSNAPATTSTFSVQPAVLPAALPSFGQPVFPPAIPIVASPVPAATTSSAISAPVGKAGKTKAKGFVLSNPWTRST
ncbi:hypothetical protein DFH08DRAFT_803986 [Mycena albidolilacea]|uniref:Uncharacterized protein n=1 Tax=Mycena albidolilacea TaxID=1033008 RepID=A0AAD7ABW7_9AGAR|nr:hypothetical protein DFH08DRAFT_803986 [Mycena albidolilacea]